MQERPDGGSTDPWRAWSQS